MVLLGLLLMAGAAAFAGLLIAYNLSGGPDYTVTLLGSQPFTISTLGAFLGGIALTLIFGLGMWMLLGGTMLARRRSKKRRLDSTGIAEETKEPRRPAAHRLHRPRLHSHGH
ncbi:hypothetical protein [Streptomyces flaveolus]|jgi:ABC-type nickel/cobalt efflux system permease component RcnA|uniref:hypothetical protein n=1 Tax=Streptomyces flaveolus TaxID=67297 RepID=UPI001998B0A4|nr:hypothetical protein [Streptomyces flaveolus]GGQ88349.1 hypothetical protein GCM10010216_57970 [Streptomyces flaveolus]